MAEVLSGDERERVEAVVGARIASAETVAERDHVVRVTLVGGDIAVVKRPREAATGPGSQGVDDLRTLFLAERAGLAHLGAMPDGPAPRLLGADDTADLLVMEDLPPGPSVADLLLGDDPTAADEAVVELARMLARVHGWSVGREPEYQAIRARVGLPDAPQRWTTRAAAGIDALRAGAQDVGVQVPAAFEEECLALIGQLASGGWARGFVHGDPCPDNTLVAGGQMRLFDFEHGNYASVLLDASYLVAPFPTCWCFGRLPEGLTVHALAAYRTELAAFIPTAGDDGAWNEALLATLAGWLLVRGRVVAQAVESDEGWGTTTMRPRLLQWMDSFLALSASGSTLPVTRSVVADLRQVLGDAWPDAGAIDFPAFA